MEEGGGEGGGEGVDLVREMISLDAGEGGRGGFEQTFAWYLEGLKFMFVINIWFWFFCTYGFLYKYVRLCVYIICRPSPSLQVTPSL